MALSKKRPLIRASSEPYIIIGVHKSMVLAHFEESLKTHSENFDQKINKLFSKKEREIVSIIYEKLRLNGFYIQGIEDGQLIFQQIVSNDGVIYNQDFSLDSDLKLTKQEILKMRKDFSNSFDGILNEVPAPLPDDFDLEDIPF